MNNIIIEDDSLNIIDGVYIYPEPTAAHIIKAQTQCRKH